LHDTRRDQNVLVVLKINLVLARNPLRSWQWKVGHHSVDSYVYCPRMQGHTTQLQYSLVKLRPVFAEMPKARLGDYSSKHRSLTDRKNQISHRKSSGFVSNRTKLCPAQS